MDYIYVFIFCSNFVNFSSTHASMLMIFQVLFEFKFKQPVISDFLTLDHVKYLYGKICYVKMLLKGYICEISIQYLFHFNFLLSHLRLLQTFLYISYSHLLPLVPSLFCSPPSNVQKVNALSLYFCI